MKYKSITVGLGRTLNSGNFESKRLDLSVIIDLDKKDKVDNVILLTKDSITQKLDDWETEVRKENMKLNFTQANSSKIGQFQQTHNNKINKNNNKFICPQCDQPMKQKEGKEYFHCQNHWGYPAMIQKGEVRAKTY